MLAPFDYHRPETLADAAALLRAYGDAAAVYAGGTELLPLMKDGLIEASHLIDIKAIPGLAGIEPDGDDGGLRLGALATHRAIERSSLVRQQLPALADLEANVANVRVRAAGTLGGNLCFAEPHSDPATLLVALDARFTLVAVDGAREIAAGDFFTGLLETARRPDELLAGIEIPKPAAGVAYERFKTHERPSASVAAVIRMNDGAISDCRIVVGSVGAVPMRTRRAEAMLAGAAPSDDLLTDAAEAIRAEVEPTADVFESTEYKRQLAATLGRRALAAAVARAGGEVDHGR
ncbi:MAG TPA: FAD binding domain-containing protein [Thermomicrobiales bacterium]|nr:FAD binding domain-containing protein [Thermomicrobiales bacterium]